jgi:hypothetical protein
MAEFSVTLARENNPFDTVFLLTFEKVESEMQDGRERNPTLGAKYAPNMGHPHCWLLSDMLGVGLRGNFNA